METSTSDEFLGGIYFKGNDPELDAELDTGGVLLEKPFYCGNCMIIMHSSKTSVFVCHKCQALYRTVA